MLQDKPIGIFDSGIGGLTVAQAIHARFPGEKILYFGDTAHLPYGDKSGDAIRYYSIKISKFLLDHDCKMIVIACNSASSAAYDVLVEFFQGKVHFVNVVDPLVDEVIKKEYKKVGVIATKATIGSNIYQNKINDLNPHVTVQQLPTPLLAPMIEEGFHNNAISQSVINEYLSDSRLRDIEALLLACTHYPLIKSEINTFLNGKVDILDSTEAAVQSVGKILTSENLINPATASEPSFFVSDYTKSFEETTKVFYKKKVTLIEKSIW